MAGMQVAQIAVVHSSEDGILDYALSLTCEYKREDGQWVGICRELGTSAYSEELEDAETQLAEAIKLQLDEMERLGYAEEYLEDNGVTPVPVDTHIGFSVVGAPVRA
ncbi:MAG: hypothetical protein F4Y49_15200 [Dehalococcoidia bacterium]|nr:hypothetical protein [Dehalococcoidia bacterium]MYK61970.1 hypothetical protein [Chloroflexota bacterium]